MKCDIFFLNILYVSDVEYLPVLVFIYFNAILMTFFFFTSKGNYLSKELFTSEQVKYLMTTGFVL